MSPSEIQKVVDHAAGQSDRWLFVALLVVGAIAFFFAARWLAAQYQKMLEQWRHDMAEMGKQLAELHSENQKQMSELHVERVKAADSYACQLREIQKEQLDNARDMARIYSEALSKNAEVMGGVQSTLKDLQSSCAIARAGVMDPRGLSHLRRHGEDKTGHHSEPHT